MKSLTKHSGSTPPSAWRKFRVFGFTLAVLFLLAAGWSSPAWATHPCVAPAFELHTPLPAVGAEFFIEGKVTDNPGGGSTLIANGMEFVVSGSIDTGILGPNLITLGCLVDPNSVPGADGCRAPNTDGLNGADLNGIFRSYIGGTTLAGGALIAVDTGGGELYA